MPWTAALLATATWIKAITITVVPVKPATQKFRLFIILFLLFALELLIWWLCYRSASENSGHDSAPRRNCIGKARDKDRLALLLDHFGDYRLSAESSAHRSPGYGMYCLSTAN